MRIWPKKGSQPGNHPTETKKASSVSGKSNTYDTSSQLSVQQQRFHSSKGGSLPLEARYKSQGLQFHHPGIYGGTNQQQHHVGLFPWGDIAIHGTGEQQTAAKEGEIAFICRRISGQCTSITYMRRRTANIPYSFCAGLCFEMMVN